MVSSSTVIRFYPREKYDGTTLFYEGIRSRIRREFSVLDLGCGIGSEHCARIRRGDAARVVGVDVDEAARQNGRLDEVVLYDGQRLPFENASFDIVFADYVMEHIDDPTSLLLEVKRVLRDGGSFHFRTPNRWHYVAVVAAVVPDRLHEAIANRSRAIHAKENKVFPTRYRFNTRRAIARATRAAGFDSTKLDLRWVECEPSYLVFSWPTFLGGLLYERLVNSTDKRQRLRSDIFGVLQV